MTEETRVFDLTHIGEEPDRQTVLLPGDVEVEMLGRDDLDPVLIAKVQLNLDRYNDETGGPVAQAERQLTALRAIIALAVPEMPAETLALIPFLDLVDLMQGFLEPLGGLTEDPRMARLVELAKDRLPTSE